MLETGGSRVAFIDSDRNIKTKTQAQIVNENELIKSLFEKKGEVVMTETVNTTDDISEALKENDFQALMAKKKLDKAKVVVAQPNVSLKLGIIGSGQAGGRIAEIFYNLGYPTIVVNTALQDLSLLQVPEANKLHLDYSVGAGGSGKQIHVGKAAFESGYSDVKAFVADRLMSADVFVATFSLGGGSGAGSSDTLVKLLNEFGKPVVVICMLPGSYDDSQAKHNAIQSLAALAEQAANGQIKSLVLCDNARVESIYPNLSQSMFWQTANNAIATPLHLFNTISARPAMEALDSLDFTVALLEAGGCSVFGQIKVSKDKYQSNDLALVEEIADNLEASLLASDFDLKEAQKIGVIVSASEKVLASIPYSNISFIFKYISEQYNSAATFKGVYAMPSESDDITVNFVFSGLGLPHNRITSLKDEAKKHMEVLSGKSSNIASKMVIDLGKDKNISEADSMMEKLKKNKSSIGQLLGGGKKSGVIDRRR